MPDVRDEVGDCRVLLGSAEGAAAVSVEVSVAFSALDNGCVSCEDGSGTDWVVCSPVTESVVGGEGCAVLGDDVLVPGGVVDWAVVADDDLVCVLDPAVVVGDGADCVVVTAR